MNLCWHRLKAAYFVTVFGEILLTCGQNVLHKQAIYMYAILVFISGGSLDRSVLPRHTFEHTVGGFTVIPQASL